MCAGAWKGTQPGWTCNWDNSRLLDDVLDGPFRQHVIWVPVLHAAASGRKVLHVHLLRPSTLACQLPVGLWGYTLQSVPPAMVGVLAHMAPASQLMTSVMTTSGIMTLHTAPLMLVNPDAADCQRWKVHNHRGTPLGPWLVPV